MAHDPNPTPPTDDPAFVIRTPEASRRVTVADLNRLPRQTVPDAFIVSTGHGASGPFTFGGAALRDVIAAFAPGAWTAAEVVSADGFGTRVAAEEWLSDAGRPILLATGVDGQPLRREEGLVRLIVPTETDEALRQVKWVGEIRLLV